MLRDIITYPNPILRKKSQNVEEFDEKLHKLLDDMNETMLHYGGVGLAAIQVAIPLNVLIINLPIEDELSEDNDKQLDENLIEAINPVIINLEGSYKYKEGCLSIPDFSEEVQRCKNIEVEYFDRFGKKHLSKFTEFMAVALQHEIDHLNGVLFIDKLSYFRRKKFEKEYKKMQKDRKNKV